MSEFGTGTLDLHINSGQAPVSCSSGLNMQFGALGTGGAGGVPTTPTLPFPLPRDSRLG